MSSPKILVYDLEFRASQKYNGSLTIYPGYIICFSCKRLGENKVRTYSALTHPGNKITDDKNLVEAIGNELRDADIHVFHYGCVTPDQRILTSDLRWVRCGDLKLGDKLVGFNEEPKKGKKYRKFVESRVLQNFKIKRPVYEVCLDDGSKITCTHDHKYLIPTGKTNGSNWLWKKASELKVGDYLPRAFEPWEPEVTYEAGYFSGILDGEGYIGKSRVNLGFAQKPNKCLKFSLKILKDRGIKFSKRLERGNEVTRVTLDGTLGDKLRTLGVFRPKRLLDKFKPGLLGTLKIPRKNRVKILSIRDLGYQEIIALGTSSKTYISEGFLSHNTRCDFKFIQTKLLYYGFDPLPIPATMIDTCKIAQQNLALKSNSLSMLAKFLGLPEQKMEITEDQWYDAFTGHAPTLKIIEKRCASDVRLTEEVYKRLKPLYPNHPMIRRVDFLTQSEYPQKCPDCGAKTHSDGMVATAKTWKERWRCRQCGRCGSVPAREVKP